jgi:integrase
VKKCRHPRAEWDRCSCAWYLVRRVEGRQVYENLGSDRREAARLARLGERVDATGETFADLGRRWLAMVEPRIRSNTLHNYRHALERAEEVLGPLRVEAISAAVVAEMEAALAAAGLAPGYITNIRVVTMGVLRFAEDAGVIEAAPSMRRFSPLARASLVKHLDPPDMEGLLATLEPSYRACFTFGWLTGLRPGELLAVEAGDIRGNVLHVARQVNTRTGLVSEVLKTTRSRRRIDLSPRALSAVWADRAGLGVPAPVAPEGRLWPFSYSSARERWHDGLVRCGLPPMGLHALRHSNASLRLAAGQDLVFMADQLGHATARVTLAVYGHLIHRPDRDVSELDRAITALGGA